MRISFKVFLNAIRVSPGIISIAALNERLMHDIGALIGTGGHEDNWL
jgi:hypothetical protein